MLESPSSSYFSETLNLLRNDNTKIDSADIQEFQKRIKTYILGQKWVGKPSALSPPACARFGWECCGPNRLRCVSCSAILCTSLPEMENSKSYDKCVENVLKALKSSHRKHCPWPFAPCPEKFFRMFPISKEAAFEDFVCRLESLLPVEKFLPVVEDKVAETLGLSYDHFRTLCELCHVSDSAFMKSSILLATTGWRRMADSGKKKYITCLNCQRTVGVWFYSPVHELTEECSPNEGDTRSELLSPIHVLPQSTKEGAISSANNHSNGKCGGRNDSVVCSLPQNSKEALICKQECSPRLELPSDRNGKRLNSNNSSSVSEDKSPARKKLCLERNKPFDSLYEHRPWCMWINEAGSTSSSQSSKDSDMPSPSHSDLVAPGYKVYIDCLLKNVGNSNPSPSPLPRPTREQLNKARELLTTWSSPA